MKHTILELLTHINLQESIFCKLIYIFIVLILCFIFVVYSLHFLVIVLKL